MRLFKKDKPFYKSVFVLGFPIALQTLVTVFVGMLDNIMLSHHSQDAFSAASLANAYISFFQIFCMGLGMGASVLVSRYYGMKKAHTEVEKAEHALRQTITLMLRLMFVFATVFAIGAIAIPRLVMKMYTSEDALIDLGSTYLRYSALTFFFLGLSLVIAIVLRSVGQSRFPLYVSLGALVVNLGGNYILIFGHFGAPKMGIAGAAIATFVARVCEAMADLIYLLVYDKKIGYRIRHFFMNTRSLLHEYIRVCIPVLISDAILAFGNNTVTMVIGHLGGDFVAANSITTVTQQLSTVMIQGVCQAGAIITGQTLGHGHRDKAEEQGWLFLGLGFALGFLSALFIFFTKTPVIASYGQETTPEAVSIAYQLLNAISLIIIFQATNSIMTKGVLRGGGDTRMLMLADNIFLWVMAIPLGILAGYVLDFPPFWIYFCLKSDQIAKTIWCVLRLRGRKWIKKISTGDNDKITDARSVSASSSEEVDVVDTDVVKETSFDKESSKNTVS
ncbi:MAG: MATE family efflux transporter [Clostridiales bacterium]|nr:MATE family efflux transporter [Clostridiales bacterium]